MQFQGKVPFLRLLLAFLAGLIVGYHYPNYFKITVWAFISITILLILIHRFLRVSYKFRWLSACFICVYLFAFGYYWINSKTTSTKGLEGIYMKEKCLILEVMDKPAYNSNFIKFTAIASIQDDSSGKIFYDRKLLVYINNDSLDKIHLGDKIICEAKISEILLPKNPGEFNYRKFTLNKGISGQIWLSSPSWKILSRSNSLGLLSRVYKFSDYLNKKLSRVFTDKNDLSVAMAMLTGSSGDFDDDLRQKYSGVGAMHILCVSGLHVGIIFLLLNSLLGFLNKTRLTRWIKSITLLLCIWMYAMITGLSPSVLRASTMFSFIILGMLLQEKPNIYNSLFASAFLLLLIDPFILTSVGFQLSYLAVIAIVSIQPLLYNTIKPRYYIIDKAWAIITVSIAAQIGTAPLAILYFHQFPNYFILTNLLVIPLYLVFSGWELVSFFPEKLLLYAVKLLNFSTERIYDFPNPVSDNLNIFPEEGILFYSILISVLLFIYFRKKRQLFFAIGFTIILISFSSNKKWQALNRKEIVKYSVKGHVAVDFISGYDHVFLADSSLINDEDKMDYHIKNHWVKTNLRQAQILKIQ
ncbi:ComEC/Rec2 family competence protein [Bacteroidota bacterium]